MKIANLIANRRRKPAQDRRRETIPAPLGVPSVTSLAKRPKVAIVGGGIAGLTAATALAERGVAVEVFESQTYLGGRVGGWTQRCGNTDLAMNRGFHAFFRQYYNLRELLSRIDPDLSMLTPLSDYPLIDNLGHRDTFRGLPRTPPWNAVMFALRSPTFRLSDFTHLDARAAAPMAAVSVPRIYEELDDTDAESFLNAIRFPEAAKHLAFEVFSRSFFAHPTELSAAELVTMFHIYFLGSNEGLIFDVPNANYNTALWDPLRQYLEQRGVRFRMGTGITRIDPADGDTLQLETDSGDTVTADGVVLATHVPGLRAIAEASPDLGNQSWRDQIARLRNAPPYGVHRMWLDRPVAAERAAFLGTAGYEPLDNISVLNRYEREAADWSLANRGSVLEMHCYAMDTASPQYPPIPGAVRKLNELYPETASATTVFEQTLIHEDCPLFEPGSRARRPGVRTPHPGLFMAGDGIRIDLPVALMERAATTGWTAANHLLSRWGIAGFPLCTVPNRSRLALLGQIATRYGKDVDDDVRSDTAKVVQ